MEENLDDIAGVVRPPVALSGTRGHGGGNYGWSVVMTLAWGGGPSCCSNMLVAGLEK